VNLYNVVCVKSYMCLKLDCLNILFIEQIGPAWAIGG